MDTNTYYPGFLAADRVEPASRAVSRDIASHVGWRAAFVNLIWLLIRGHDHEHDHDPDPQASKPTIAET